MLLALDIGNTRTKLGWFDGADLAAADHRPTTDEPSLPADRPVTEAVLSGVVPTALAAWSAWLGERGVCVRRVGDDLAVPLTVDYHPPESLGADRLLGALAAAHRHGSPVLTADCGTATTLNVVANGDVFVGGAICCGLGTARDALAREAALLPRIELEPPAGVLGRDTAACLRSGLVLAHAGMISWLAQRLRAEANLPSAPLVATGGHAAVLARALPGVFAEVDPHLVLRGLAATYWENVHA